MFSLTSLPIEFLNVIRQEFLGHVRDFILYHLDRRQADVTLHISELFYRREDLVWISLAGVLFQIAATLLHALLVRQR